MAPYSVALIFGGRSSEHEISVISAHSIAANIDPERYTIIPCYISRDGQWFMDGLARDILHLDIASILRKSSAAKTSELLEGMRAETRQTPFNFDFHAAGIDIAFLALHGAYGEDGRVQGMLETCGLPYTGCGVTASAVAMDKALTKLVAADAGLGTAPSTTLLRSRWQSEPERVLDEILETHAMPLFIKPVSLGSSVGISKVHTPDELAPALELACRLDTKVLVEEAVHGREIEVAVLGNEHPEASSCGEIEPGKEFYDYEDKYIGKNAKMYVPARIPADLQDKVRQAALRIYRALECQGMARVDFFVDDRNGSIVFNELNTIPGFTDISMYPRLMQESGITFTELTHRLLQLGLERKR